MAKGTKRGLSLLLALAMALSMVVIPASAASITALTDDASTWTDAFSASGAIDDGGSAAVTTEGGAITLKADLVVKSGATAPINNRFQITKSLTLDLNGHTLDLGSYYLCVKRENDGADNDAYKLEVTITDRSADKDGAITSSTQICVLAVLDKSTVTLEDVEIASTCEEAQYTTDDKGGKKYTSLSVVQLNTSGKLKVTGDTRITAAETTKHSNGIAANFTVAAYTDPIEITMESGLISGAAYGIAVLGKNSTGSIVTFGGSAKIEGAEHGISTNGTNTPHDDIQITGGTIEATEEGAGVYLPAGSLTVSAGTISGGAGIVVRGGTLKVTGGTITATAAANAQLSIGDNGKKISPAAVAVDNSRGYNNGQSSVTITNGTFIAEDGVPAVALSMDGESQKDTNHENITVSGGAFSAPVDGTFLSDALKFAARRSGAENKAPYSYHETASEAQDAAGAGGEVAAIGSDDDPSDFSGRVYPLEPDEGGTKAQLGALEMKGGVYEIELTGKATPSKGGAPQPAYWIGVGIAPPDGYTSVAYAPGDYSTDKDLTFTRNNNDGSLDDIQDGSEGFAIWLDAGSMEDEDIYYSVQWTAAGKPVCYEVYRFTWSGTLEGELPEPPPDKPDPPEPETYTITIESGIVNGTVEADKREAKEGETVKLTVTPSKGYQLKSLTATYTKASDTVVYAFQLTESVTGAATYTFPMPGSHVTLSAVFEGVPLTGVVTIAGVPRSGETLKVSVTDSNNTGAFSYQWSADTVAIANATGDTYRLTDNEVGKRITCTVTSSVQTGSIKSAETAPVVAEGAELTTYTVRFDVRGHGTAPADQSVYAYGKATRPADPTASGYTFGGWFKDAEGTTPFDFDSEITADITLYAKWTENQPSDPAKTYKITIASNIAHGTVTADKDYAKAGDTVTLTITPSSGYYLKEISTTPALTLSVSDSTRTFTMPASDVSVSATFALNSSAPALTGYVTIEGEPWVGETLTAIVRNSNNTGTLYYQWYADNSYIYGGTSRYLELSRYEIGKYIRCVVTSSVQTGSIVGWYWDTVDYYNNRYHPAENPTNGNTGTGQGSNAGAGNDFTIETPIFTTTTNADGTKTTTVLDPDGSSGLVILTSYGAVSSASMTFSSSALTSALRTGIALTLPAAVQPARSADSAAPVRIVLPQATSPVKVKIPVLQMTEGTVAVLENYFGPDQVVRSSVSQSDGVLFELTGSAVVKIVDNSRSFRDVSDSAWYANAVKWASSREVLNGVSAQMFDPQGTVNRAMMAQMLYNFDGADDMGAPSQFSDVSSGDWYAASVAWATKNGIARNDGERFGAKDALTREDMATMLYNYAKAKGYNPTASGSTPAFSDAGDVSDWARTAMQWAVGRGLITGTQNGTKAVVLDPQGTVTRAQLATIMQRFHNLY